MSYLGTFASGMTGGQVSRMREGQHGVSQKSPSLLLHVAVRSRGRDWTPDIYEGGGVWVTIFGESFPSTRGLYLDLLNCLLERTRKIPKMDTP